MSGGDLAVVVVAVAALLATAALAGAAVWLVVVVRDLRQAVDRLVVETDATLVEMRAVVDQAEDDLERADSVIATLESVSDRVDAASELAVETFSRPVIRAVSIGSGTARAARRLRRRA
jgi:hypothetical protein